MRKSTAVALAVLGALTLSAFLAPLLYAVMPFFKFEKILNRLLMISAVLICFAFIRFDRSLFETCGFNRPFSWKNAVKGLGMTCAVLAALTFLEIRLGAFHLQSGWQPSFGLLASAALTGAVVAITEEFFFRGYVFLKLRSRFRLISAALVTSMIYSLVHFLKGGRPLIDSTPTIWDSFRVIAASFSALARWQEIWPGFLGLFLFGLVLTYAFLRTGSLWLSIGIHGGAVFFIKFTSHLLEFQEGFSRLFYGGKGFYTGFLGWIFILLIGVLVRAISISAPSSRPAGSK